jgi:hypothetical protein
MIEITKKEFEAYEKVRKSGKTNMFNTGMVGSLSGLDISTIRAIMENYNELDKKFGGD